MSRRCRAEEAAMQNGLIAGIGLTHLTVYNQSPAPDGCHSGCAHVHAVTDEAYFVLAGTGAIELHDLERGFRSVPLAPGSYVQFAPGTLHRAVNNGGLVVLAIMGNAGLAERGDARIWFGADADADPELYQQLCTLPARKGLEGALERRDRSVSAYMQLLRLWNAIATPIAARCRPSSICMPARWRRCVRASKTSSRTNRQSGCKPRSRASTAFRC
jgi:mannose-6-phosphate isomerase-like protein (cupin superfamily)